MKKIRILTIISIVLLCLYCGKDTPSTAEKGDAVQDSQQAGETDTESQNTISEADKAIILTINNAGYTNKHLKDFILSRYSDGSSGEILDNPRILSRMFDTFVESRMVLYSVNKENIPLENEELESFLNDKHISSDKINDPEVRNSVRVRKFLYLKLYKEIDVTDAEVRRYYQGHLDEFRRESEVELHQIVVKDKEKAYDIHRRLLRHPEKFAEIASTESQSRDKDRGGLMGYFSKGTLPKDMEDVVFSLELNAISPVTDSPYGHHIFKVTKRKQKRLLALDAVTPQIKNTILSDKMRWAYEDFMARLKKELVVDVKYDQLYFTYHAVPKGDQYDETKKPSDSVPDNSDNNS